MTLRCHRRRRAAEGASEDMLGELHDEGRVVGVDASRGRCAGREVGETGTEGRQLVIVAPGCLGDDAKRAIPRVVECSQRASVMLRMHYPGDLVANVSSLGPFRQCILAAAASNGWTIVTSSACHCL
jgi:hypothetical protein